MLNPLRRALSVLAAVVLAVCAVAPAGLHPARREQPGAAPPDAKAPAPLVSKPLPRIDLATGRDLANYPPDVTFDHISQHLRVTIPDVRQQRLQGELELTSRAIGSPRTRLTLNAKATISVKSVTTMQGKPIAFTHTPPMLAIDFPTAVAAGKDVSVRINYEATGPFGDGVGLVWLQASDDGKTPAMIYSQGQADWNSAWFPCHDFPNDRLMTEMTIDAPGEFTALSNGRLVAPPAVKGDRKVWRYRLNNPQPTYLVSMVIGKFDSVRLSAGVAGTERVPMTVYGPPGSADKLKAVFARTRDMLMMLEKTLDMPYPWDEYNQVIVRDFRWGGMENTALTTLTHKILDDDDATADELIVHELAHQWLGDMITCRSWEHTWLNEGWATYAEALWARHRRGDDGYVKYIRDWRDEIVRTCTGVAPQNQAMVTNRYHEPDDLFDQAEDPYKRGGLVLHMLHERLGDEAFWRGTRDYVKRFAFKQVETDDFRRCLEEAGGVSLQRFFDQWCRRPGVPRLDVVLTWNAAGGAMECSVVQTQTINSANPAYQFDLPIEVELAGGVKRTITIATDTRTAALSAKLPGRPVKVTVDPRLSVLAEVRIKGDWPEDRTDQDK